MANTETAAFGGSWLGGDDNSGTEEGRLLIVNAGGIQDDIYVRSLDVDPDAPLQIQFDIRNLLTSEAGLRDGILSPDVTFEVRDSEGTVLDSIVTGDVPANEAWNTFSFEVDPQGNDTVEIALVNNTAGNFGNDFGVDNIIVSQKGSDQDGDGIINSLDLDSDGDGISDNVEAQNGSPFVAPTGEDSDGNGLDDVYESEPGAGEGLTPADTNDDARSDFLDDSAPVLDFALIETQDNAEVESIDLSGEGDNVLSLLAADILSMNEENEVLVLGNEGDVIEARELTQTGPSDNVDGHSVSINSLDGAALLVEEEVAVIV